MIGENLVRQLQNFANCGLIFLVNKRSGDWQPVSVEQYAALSANTISQHWVRLSIDAAQALAAEIRSRN